MSTSFAVLAYHSHSVGGQWSAVNDHQALADDLRALTRAGHRVVPVARLADWLDEKPGACCPAGAVCLTFDDGCDLDVEDIDFPEAGLQRSFLGIMRDFLDEAGPDIQPQLHATSFVIASPDARCAIDRRSLFGRGWISDDWWRSASDDPLLSIGSHGWDHNHADIDPDDGGRGAFTAIDTEEACRQQVIEAARFIADRSGTWPDLFAYPFGESSAYLRDEFLPEHVGEHRLRAAFGAEPDRVTRNSNRWELPRFVCGRDWDSAGELLRLLED